MPRFLLHLEGAVVFAAAVYAYIHLEGGWLLFVLLFLAPDVSILGYALGTQAGSRAYNAAHTYALPLLLLAAAHLFGWALGWETAGLAGVIWIAHIGMDRMLGYGLKYATHFKDSNLGRV